MARISFDKTFFEEDLAAGIGSFYLLENGHSLQANLGMK